MNSDDHPLPTPLLGHEMMQNESIKHTGPSIRRTVSTSIFLQTSITAILLIILCVLQSASCFRPCTNVNPAARTRTINSRADAFYQQMTATVTEPEASETPRRTPRAETESSQPSSSAAFGQWEEVEGNFILRPSIEDGPPRALGT